MLGVRPFRFDPSRRFTATRIQSLSEEADIRLPSIGVRSDPVACRRNPEHSPRKIVASLRTFFQAEHCHYVG